MTDRQWKFWENRNMGALTRRYGPKRARKELAKLKEKVRRNEARLKSCKLHDFDWRAAIKRDRASREKWGVEVGIYSTVVTASGYCRCKNCGGKMPIMYAAPYMDAVEQMRKPEYCLKADKSSYFYGVPNKFIGKKEGEP